MPVEHISIIQNSFLKKLNALSSLDVRKLKFLCKVWLGKKEQMCVCGIQHWYPENVCSCSCVLLLQVTNIFKDR